jgi:putative multiple sugar transport system substrate-binding protein
MDHQLGKEKSMKRIPVTLLMAMLTVLAVLLSSCGSAAPTTPASNASAPTAAPAAATAAPAAATEAPAAATAAPAADSGKQFTVGISMPTKSSARWISDGENMVKVFTDMGYKTNLQYAEDDIPNQVAQLENMITTGVDALVIAAIDNKSLSTVLQTAKDKKILVVAYDRLIRDTPNVDYYATFDNFKVGVLQAQYIEQALGLKDGKGPFNIELFGGSPDDNNAFFFYDGAMSVLKPYIDSKKLVVVSGQMGMDKVSTLRWDGATAQARMDNLLSAYYGNKRVDAVLSPYDGISRGIISSLKGVGYGSADQPMPVVTGQDAEIPSVKSILAGEQAQTVFKDTRDLAKAAVTMVDAALNGKDVPVNDTKTYNNGVKVIPSQLLVPVSVDKNNWEQILVGSGYYTKDQVGQ